MSELTFLLGGARSGKSTAAVRLALETRLPVVFIATGEARDDEMAARIEQHRSERPRDWDTIEAPVGLGDALLKVPDDAVAIVDCLTLWVSNLMELGETDADIEGKAAVAAEIARGRPSPTIAVSNEVGRGIVPGDALSRRFRDVLGRVNAVWAEHAHRSFFFVAGRAVKLEAATISLEGER